MLVYCCCSCRNSIVFVARHHNYICIVFSANTFFQIKCLLFLLLQLRHDITIMNNIIFFDSAPFLRTKYCTHSPECFLLLHSKHCAVSEAFYFYAQNIVPITLNAYYSWTQHIVPIAPRLLNLHIQHCAYSPGDFKSCIQNIYADDHNDMVGSYHTMTTISHLLWRYIYTKCISE